MADSREQFTSGLADRYAIERELGRGGMATVYLARDLRHRQGWKDLKNGQLHTESRAHRINVLSPTAAVVTTKSTTTAESAGKKQRWQNLWTGVWVNQNGRWVVVQQRSSTVPATS